MGDQQFGGNARGGVMRTVGLFVDRQAAAVETGGCGDAIAECARRAQGESAAHAVSGYRHWTRCHEVGRVQPIEIGSGVLQCFFGSERRPRRAQCDKEFRMPFRIGGIGHREHRRGRGSVENIGRQHGVAVGRDGLHHFAQPRPQAVGVHIEQHPGMGGAVIGSGQVGVGIAVRGADIEGAECDGHRHGI